MACGPRLSSQLAVPALRGSSSRLPRGTKRKSGGWYGFGGAFSQRKVMHRSIRAVIILVSKLFVAAASKVHRSWDMIFGVLIMFDAIRNSARMCRRQCPLSRLNQFAQIFVYVCTRCLCWSLHPCFTEKKVMGEDALVEHLCTSDKPLSLVQWCSTFASSPIFCSIVCCKRGLEPYVWKSPGFDKTCALFLTAFRDERRKKILSSPNAIFLQHEGRNAVLEITGECSASRVERGD